MVGGGGGLGWREDVRCGVVGCLGRLKMPADVWLVFSVSVADTVCLWLDRD